MRKGNRTARVDRVREVMRSRADDMGEDWRNAAAIRHRVIEQRRADRAHREAGRRDAREISKGIVIH